MLTDCLDKINKGSAKGAASFFCTNILKQLEPDLNDEELASVDQAITEILKARFRGCEDVSHAVEGIR